MMDAACGFNLCVGNFNDNQSIVDDPSLGTANTDYMDRFRSPLATGSEYTDEDDDTYTKEDTITKGSVSQRSHDNNTHKSKTSQKQPISINNTIEEDDDDDESDDDENDQPDETDSKKPMIAPTENDSLLRPNNDIHRTDPDLENGTLAERANYPDIVASPSGDSCNDSLGMESQTSISVKTVARLGIESLKYMYSLALLLFSVTLIVWSMFTKQTVATSKQGIHAGITLAVVVVLICWLGLMEGGQGCLVGLQPVAKSLYANSHPVAMRNTNLAHKGDNMERFMVGRQFLVVLVIFVINICTATIKDASLPFLSSLVLEIFLASGFAVILTTVIVGQLTAQVNAANCMLDFINNHVMLFTIYVSLAIEASGMLHSVYLVNLIFSKISGHPVQSREPPRTWKQQVVFGIKVVFSLIVLAGCCAVTLQALNQGDTMMWEGLPDYVTLILFAFLMCFAGIMEGMQIALFAVANMAEDDLKVHPMAYKSCKLVFKGHNLGAFLIGRQICVTLCMFVVARITNITVDLDDPNAETIFGVNRSVQTFFNTGLLGAVITTIVGSLMWRVIASAFPVAFLTNPAVYVIIYICLFLEQSGVCSASWILASVQKLLIRLESDDNYFQDSDLGSRSMKSAGGS